MNSDSRTTGDRYVEADDAMSPRICYCKSVHEATLRRAIRAGHRTVKALGCATEAGTRCQTCHPDLQLLIDEEDGHRPE